MWIIDCEQGSPEWLAARLGVGTASQFGRIITASGKASASADAYIAELIDEVARPMELRDEDEQAAQFSGNRHTDRGHALEPKARNWYRFVTGADVAQVGFMVTADRSLGCSPDSLVDTADGLRGGLEIKCPEGKKHVLWMMDGTLPDEHKQQVHGCLALSGYAFWDFVSYCPGYKPFLVRTVPDAYTALVAAELKKFAVNLAKFKEQFVEYLPHLEQAA